MLHIILLILKIIGIIILSIIGLLLFVLLVCLFVPVVYRIKAVKKGQDMHGFVRVFWLIINVKASMNNKDKEVKVKIRILGIPLEVFQKIGHVCGKAFKGIAKLFTKRDKTDRTTTPATQATTDENVNQAAKVENDSISQVIKEEVKDEVDKEVKQEPIKEENKATADEEKSSEDSATSKEGVWNRIKTLLIKIYYFPQWLYERVRKIYLTISKFCGKIKQWKDFLTSDTFKRALRFVLNRGNALRKHILPRKITGNVTYGFDDPSLTGQALAVLSIITPLYKGKLQIIPMFNQQILEGDIYMKGHILGFTLVRIAWSVYRNKDVKEVIHHFSQKEA